MDNFFSRLSAFRPQLLSILRIVTALLFLEHATMKLFGFPPMQMPAGMTPPAGGGGLSPFIAIGVLELVGSLMLIAGFWTRLAAFVLSGEMAVAYFMAHAPQSFYRSSIWARRRSCSASCSCTSPRLVPAPGRWTPRGRTWPDATDGTPA